jgi:hypothetical protein
MNVRDSDVLEWVRGQRKVSQVLGAFGLLDFTMLRPVLAWRAFWNLLTVSFFGFSNFFRAAVNRGYWLSGYGGTTVCSWCQHFSCCHLGYRTIKKARIIYVQK